MPSGDNQWTQLLASKRLRSKGDLTKVQAKLWYGLQVAEAGLKGSMAEDDGESVRKWLHCLTQLANVYSKVALDGDLEQRLKTIEARLAEEDQAHAGTYSPARKR